MALRLVVGLGNPGEEYSRTRHNVGFALLDRLAGEGSDWKDYERGLGLWTKSSSLFLLKPMTYMNLSGDCVQPFAAFYKIKPEETLIVYDEIALPLGDVRLRPKGSAGGHNGMKSIIGRLGTDQVPRLRIGIGPQPQFMDSAKFVLAKFTAAERETLEKALDKAEGAVEAAASLGLDAAMNKYNPKA